MRSLIAVLLLLAGVSTSAAADQITEAMNPSVDTEADAEAVLERTIMRIEAAVPALTPEEQRYVRQENEFADAMGKKAGIYNSYTSERVSAFWTTKQFYEWEVHREMAGLQQTLDSLHKIRSSDARFALWAMLVVHLLSANQATENALAGLRRLGVINRSDLGPAEGVSWLTGPAEGGVQLFWANWADTMWYAWAYEGVFRATGASKLMTLHMPPK